MFKRIFMAVALVGITVAPVQAADGAKVWKKCKGCHNYNKAKNKVGPYLQGIIGRKCGAVGKFKYGKDYKKICAASAWTWDAALLDEYLADPKRFVKARGGKRSKMAFKLKKPDNRKAVIQFLTDNAK